MKSHYDTLGVSPTATKDEIKKAYRKLVMKTHPDVAPNANEERFKRISEAHSILTDDNARKRYQYEMESSKMHRHAGFAGNGDHGYSGRGSKNLSNTMRFLDGIYRPRNLFFGLTLGFITVSCIRSFLSTDDEKKKFEKHTGKKNLVEAWMNPRTNQWEQPAPWDATYRRLQPELHLVQRDLVSRRDQR